MTIVKAPASPVGASEGSPKTCPSEQTVKTIEELVTDAENAVTALEQLEPVQNQRPETWPRAVFHPQPMRDRWWFDSTGMDFGRIPEAKTAEDAYEAASIGVRSAREGRNNAEALLPRLEDVKRRLRSVSIELQNGEPR